MNDIRKWGVVTRFELQDALRSKLVVIVVALYAAGSALGSFVFIKSVQAMQERAREFLAEQSGISPDTIPLQAVREQATTLLLDSVENEGLRQSLSELEPLAIFYGYMSLLSVPLLLLAVSAGSHAADIQSGAARFALFRCSRGVWAWGKFSGHAILLALGLFVGASVTGLFGALFQNDFQVGLVASLFLASLRTWIYGMAFLGIFSGISLAVRTPLRAKASCLFALIGMAVAHSLFASDYFAAQAPWATSLRWLFPAEYKEGLWINQFSPFVASLVGLFVISVAGVSLGTLTFVRKDA